MPRITRFAIASFLFLASSAFAAPLFGPPERLNVYLASGRSIQSMHGQASIESLQLELVRSWSPRTEVGFILAPMNVQEPRSWFGNHYGDPDETARGAALSPMIRRRLFRESPSYEPFVELSTGPMWTTRRVPAATSHFNFISQVGGGAVLFPRRPLAMVVGYRFAHISNGGLASRNPGLNVHTLLIGTRFRP
ncbi:MAG TPA: acyloxyacyl hydrolase [Thermoanaerobaculia bacterium]|nr:acyloxyacyl hydrolase [Thermoanaerobaculia bacterium]